MDVKGDINKFVIDICNVYKIKYGDIKRRIDPIQLTFSKHRRNFVAAFYESIRKDINHNPKMIINLWRNKNWNEIRKLLSQDKINLMNNYVKKYTQELVLIGKREEDLIAVSIKNYAEEKWRIEMEKATKEKDALIREEQQAENLKRSEEKYLSDKEYDFRVRVEGEP